MIIDDLSLPASEQILEISPTDISQFIRLEQCQRYLRLRLHEGAAGRNFMRRAGLTPQAIPPLLTRAGAAFEDTVETAIAAGFPTYDFAAAAGKAQRGFDNAQVVARARSLPPGATAVLFQARLVVPLDGWLIRGDADILRLERHMDGALRVLIADMKSSATAKVEHRLQVAFYHAMLAGLFVQEDVPVAAIETAILYRGLPNPPADLPPDDIKRLNDQQDEARTLFGTEDGFLERVLDADAYLDAVHDLVTGPDSTARQLITQPFAAVPYHLTSKCDGCLYNEFCMQWSAQQDDLSLLPHLTTLDKDALQRAGVRTVQTLARLKEFAPTTGISGSHHSETLVPSPGEEALVGRLASTWPVGPRLDELIHRARRYRQWKKEDIAALSYIPNKGHGSLPYSDATHNPNLVRVYLDAQQDYLHNRLYLLGARIVGCENGVEVVSRSRNIVHLAAGPPETDALEADLLVAWIRETLAAVVELAALDEWGEASAPIHLIFYDRLAQQVLLEALARHGSAILEATPLYDFLTQLAGYDSPVATFLETEIRELKNYPMVCQSLQAVAAYLRFDWRTPEDYRALFQERLFDFWGRLPTADGPPGAGDWYTNRARFNSQIPLEYAYAAWDALEPPATGTPDSFAPYRSATPDRLRGFQARRLEALEHIAHDFSGNRLTEKRPFRLPDLAQFAEKATTLARALDEFVTIERHVELAAWRATRNLAPERRALMGETLLVRYLEADQVPGVAEANRENEHRRLLKEQQRADYQTARPDAKQVRLSKEQKAASEWSQEGLHLRLRVEMTGLDCGLAELLALITLGEGDGVVIYPRLTVDERLPIAEQVPHSPTPKQLLYGTRGAITSLIVERDANEQPRAAIVEVELRSAFGGPWSRGFLFPSMDRPLLDGQVYTLDPDPNNWYGYWCAAVSEALAGLPPAPAEPRHALYERLALSGTQALPRPTAALAGQARFLAGLQALAAVGALHEFEPSKQDYIGAHGDDPLLLVQGPPGTGKSFTTAYAVLARLQGAMAADQLYRVFLTCKTHGATDVLIEKVLDAQERLRRARTSHPALFATYFDARLLDELPLYRLTPRHTPPVGILPVPKDRDRAPGDPSTADRLALQRWAIVATTPGGTYSMIKERWDTKNLFGHYLCHCLVLDEASQMNLPEAMLAALPLDPAGQVIAVGDSRQMPPIVKHDWEAEPRRTFQEYKSYESLFLHLLGQSPRPPLIQFAITFRLHADMAAFLKEAIYRHDGIDYHSFRHDELPALIHPDPFVTAVLTPHHPLVVILHDEAASQTRNLFEQALVAPVLAALADPLFWHLGLDEGLGVVVPHRAQRAGMQAAFPFLTALDPQTGATRRSAVDTVERFQGGEREAILVSATESDPAYLLTAGEFLYDPRRLTVAISRAKRKMILVAARSVFSLFSPDEDAFANAQLWKHLLRRTCTIKLWEGIQDGHRVEVWGNRQSEVRVG